MVCGTLKTVSGPYGQTLTCEAFADKPLADVLKEVMSHLHAEFHFQDIELQESGAVEASIPAEPDVRNFSFCIRNGNSITARTPLCARFPLVLPPQRVCGC